MWGVLKIFCQIRVEKGWIRTGERWMERFSPGDFCSLFGSLLSIIGWPKRSPQTEQSRFHYTSTLSLSYAKLAQTLQSANEKWHYLSQKYKISMYVQYRPERLQIISISKYSQTKDARELIFSGLVSPTLNYWMFIGLRKILTGLVENACWVTPS